MKRLFSLLPLLIVFFRLDAQQSFQVTFNHDGKIVHGTFSRPDGSARFPTIIIAPGSGQNDRDGTFPMIGGNIPCLYPELLNDTLRPYKQLSEALVDSGFAVLRYDKLEYSYPTTLGTITFHKLWLPVESAIQYVKARSDVDTNRIILLGHSEGSTLIPFIAKNRTDVKALISIAGARTPFDSILAYQVVDIERRCHGDTITAKAQADQILYYFSVIRTHNWPPNFPDLLGVSPEVWYDYFQATDPVADNYNADHLCTLFIGMGKDINVPPSELDRFRNEITVTDDFWSIPDLVHFMNPYDDPHVSETLTDTIVYWLKNICLTTGIRDPHPVNPDLVKISPNPFSTSITIQMEEINASKISCTIYNLFGQPVLKLNPTDEFGHDESIDLSFLPPGVYYFSIVNGKQVLVKKIVKN